MRTLSESRFEVAAGSVTGAAHREVGRGSQDGCSILQVGDTTIAVVSDGCGSSPSSASGALIGAPLMAAAISRELEPGRGLDIAGLLRARAAVLGTLDVLTESMAGARADVVRDHFLFTLVGAVVGPVSTLAFAIGDGVVGINGNLVSLEPAAGNAPAYLAYELLEETAGLGELSFISISPTIELRSLVIATDGAGGLELAKLADDDSIYRNSDALRRRLEKLASGRTRVDWERQLIVRPAPALRDDATIVSIRARPHRAETSEVSA